MDAMNDNEGFSAEDLKSQLYQSLHSSGLLKQLKGQLRQSMINELRGKGNKRIQTKIKSKHSDLLATTIKQKKSTSNWIHQAIDNLVYLHLKQNGYQYSLSLFEQESSVDTYTPSLMDDLLQRLGLRSSDLDISADTPASSYSEDFSYLTSTPNQRKDHGLALWVILDKLSSFAASKPLPQIEQVKFLSDDDKPMSLGEKLKAIDEEMQLKATQTPRDPAVTVNSYTTAVRRAEEDAERRAKSHFEQWKSLELVNVKMEESKKSKDYVDTRIRELEQDYQSKREALQSREKGAISRLQHQREMLEREMHEQRQSLLREIDQIRMREEILHKQEQALHEIELLKRDELKLLRYDVGKSIGKQSKEPICSKTEAQSQTCTADHEFKKLQDQLGDKSNEMSKLKQELFQLKAELSNANRFNQTLANRENLLLKSHLEQLTREIKGNKATPEDTKESLVEEQLRQEIKKLTEERTDQDTQQRSLAQTLKDMQHALEDSNAALARFNAVATTSNPSNPKKKPPNVSDVILSYSPAPQRDTLREYEPVQTSLHPGLFSSSEFDDPSMDEKVASASVRLDLMQRLRELEDQTYAVDEHYHRYLRTHYRNTETQISNLNAQAPSVQMQVSQMGKTQNPLSCRSKPSHEVAYRNTQAFPAKVAASPIGKDKGAVSFRKPIYKVGESHIDKEIEIILSSPSRDRTTAIIRPDLDDSNPLLDLQHEEPVKDDSMSSNEPSIHDEPDDKLGVAMKRIDPAIRNQSVSSGIKLSMDSLGGGNDVTSSSKTSSLESFSPKMDTARRVDVKKKEIPLEDVISSPRTLPPIAGPRKLPSLPPKPAVSSVQKDPDSPHRLSVSSIKRVSPQKTDPVDVLNSGNAAPQSSESEDSSKYSHHRIQSVDVESKDVSISDNFVLSDKRTSPVFLESISLTQHNLPQASERSEATRSPSVVSEMSLPSFSSNSNINPLMNLDKPEAEKEELSISTKASESISGRRNPVAGGSQSHFHPAPSTSEDSVSEKMVEESKPMKTLGDFDLSNEEGIAAALRFSDAHQPALNFSEEEDLVADVEQAPGVPEHREQVEEPELKEIVDVFDISDHHELDSIESGKGSLQDIRSDVSW